MDASRLAHVQSRRHGAVSPAVPVPVDFNLTYCYPAYAVPRVRATGIFFNIAAAALVVPPLSVYCTTTTVHAPSLAPARSLPLSCVKPVLPRFCFVCCVVLSPGFVYLGCVLVRMRSLMLLELWQRECA